MGSDSFLLLMHFFVLRIWLLEFAYFARNPMLRPVILVNYLGAHFQVNIFTHICMRD